MPLCNKVGVHVGKIKLDSGLFKFVGFGLSTVGDGGVYNTFYGWMQRFIWRFSKKVALQAESVNFEADG